MGDLEYRFAACVVGCFFELPVPKVKGPWAIWQTHIVYMIERSKEGLEHAKKSGLLPVMPIGQYNQLLAGAGLKVPAVAVYTEGHVCVFDVLKPDPETKVIKGETYAMLNYESAEFVI